MDKIPVVLITGFLGSGKTTLLNHILTHEHGKKIAVVENEYGAINIDKALVQQKIDTAEEIFEMNNGCVCCSVRGDLIRTLGKLLKRKNKFDAILIETTGLADPRPVILTFYVEEALSSALRLDAVLTVVDAKHILQHICEKKEEGIVNEAVQQIAMADRVLLNKVDLVTGDEKAKVLRAIKAINGEAVVTECKLATEAPDMDSLLGLCAFDLNRVLESGSIFADSKVPFEADDVHSHHNHDHHHHHDEPDACEHCQVDMQHRHESGVGSVALQLKGDVNPRLLNEWLSLLLQERGPDLYRSKGILSFHGSDDRHVFQGVHQMMQFSSSAEGHGRQWANGEVRMNQLVFIGKELDREELTAAFRSCLVDS